jgi:hypothetical protein
MEPIDHIGTGRALAIAMAGRFPRQDWVAELADRAHKSRDFVEWHLQEDIEPPAEVLTAAGEMLRERNESDGGSAEAAGETEGSHMTKDDLPFAGLPGNLGKLRRE